MTHHAMRHASMLLVAAIAATVAVMTFSSSPASAYPVPPGAYSVATAGVVNTDGGVYWRASPHTNDYQAIAGYGAYDGDTVGLDCWAYGDAVGPYGNTLWYFVEKISPSGYVGDGDGWINDHYLDTPGTAANPQPIGPECSGY